MSLEQDLKVRQALGNVLSAHCRTAGHCFCCSGYVGRRRKGETRRHCLCICHARPKPPPDPQ